MHPKVAAMLMEPEPYIFLALFAAIIWLEAYEIMSKAKFARTMKNVATLVAGIVMLEFFWRIA